MLIKMRTQATGPKVNLASGKVYEVGHHLTAEFAKNLMDGGYAEEVQPETTATGDEGETAQAPPDKKTRTRKRRGASKKVSG